MRRFALLLALVPLAALAVPATAAPPAVSGDCQFAAAGWPSPTRVVVVLDGWAVAADAAVTASTGVRCDLLDASGVLVATSATYLVGPAAATATVVETELSAFTVCWTGWVKLDGEMVHEGPHCIPPI